MNNQKAFPHAMTFKELVFYIIATIIIGVGLVIIRDDYSGIIGAVIVCPAIIGYFIYAYNKEKKSDAKAIQVNRSITEGDYFESSEWHAKYVEYINQHPFERPVFMNMKQDLLKRFRRREYLMWSAFLVFLMFCSVCALMMGRYVVALIGVSIFGALLYMEISLYIGMPVRRWLKKDIDYDALQASYIKSRMLTYKKNGLAFGTTHIHAFTEKKIYAIDYRLVEGLTRKVVRLKKYEDGIYSSEEYQHYAVIHVRLPESGNIVDVEIELNEYQVQMAIDNYPSYKLGTNADDSTVVSESNDNVVV